MSHFINDERTVLVRQEGDVTVALRNDPDAIWGPPITLHYEGDQSADIGAVLTARQARLVDEVFSLLDTADYAWLLRSAATRAGINVAESLLIADQIVAATAMRQRQGHAAVTNSREAVR